MSGNTPYDIAIVGSGSAAFATAIEARRRGASVVMIERGTVGGTCVNVGCVPSKALLAAAAARHVALAQPFPGVDTSAGPVDAAALVAGKDEIVSALRESKYVALADLYGFSIIEGEARFVEGPALEVNGERIDAAHFVVATGAAPWAPPIPGLAEVDYLTSTSAMALEEVPASLVVIGANAVGLEQAQLFSRLGATVSVLEALDRVAPFEEPELSDALAASLAAEGITIVTSANVTGVRRAADGVTVSLESPRGPEEIVVEALLVATGRRPSSEHLGLDLVGVERGERAEVVVDDELRTSNPRIFAAGDVTGHPQFVYVAGRHGAVVAANALADAHDTVDYSSMPRVTFTSPTLASVGLTEEQARASGLDVESRVLSFDNVPRGIVSRETRGVAKMVAEATTGRVLGVHLLSEGAGDAILAAVYALEAGFTVERLVDSWAPYLTNAEAIKLVAQSFTRDVAELSCCAS